MTGFNFHDFLPLRYALNGPPMPPTYTTRALAEALNGELVGDGQIPITRLAHPADVRDPGDLALAMDIKLLPLLEKRSARAAVVSRGAQLAPGLVEAAIVVDRPRLALAKLTGLFAVPVPVNKGVHPSAVIEPGAKLGANVCVGALAFIGAGAVIGEDSTLHPQSYVGPGAVLGRAALVYPGVKIGAGVMIGERCIVHFNASLGADCFSFVTPQPGSVEQVKSGGGGTVTATNYDLVRIASLGGIVIGDDVEIGANTSIDRGTIAPTRIGNGTKIDNQVQIGHNSVIGSNCLICGHTGIAGSVTIGDRVVLGGAVGIADHLTIGDDAVVMAMSGVGGNVAAKTVVGGLPASPRERVMENLFNVSRLKHFFRKIEALTERLDRLENKNKE
ncbi:MAG TPA: UDP-3-O-(3-hydroxymyristoyl)glucosamine N-acyltransferase [Roseiarcus sp.]|nr:UDP-3-O-(3-hydroxymyristoyl)glucosamine N-acyltransferase [Roseiarcus sp.]